MEPDAAIAHISKAFDVEGKVMALSKTSRCFMDLIDVEWPILQAPMAGTSTPEMAAAVSNAGALGQLAVGTATAEAASKAIQYVRAETGRPFNINVFCHEEPRRYFTYPRPAVPLQCASAAARRR